MGRSHNMHKTVLFNRGENSNNQMTSSEQALWREQEGKKLPFNWCNWKFGSLISGFSCWHGCLCRANHPTHYTTLQCVFCSINWLQQTPHLQKWSTSACSKGGMWLLGFSAYYCAVFNIQYNSPWGKCCDLVLYIFKKKLIEVAFH